METLKFEYVVYIRAKPEELFRALVEPEITTKYWQHVNVSDWKPGSRWEHRRDGREGEALLVGRVIEHSPPRRLVLSWAFPADEAEEGRHTLVSFDLEALGEVLKLTLTHERLEPGSEMLVGITDGWPKVLSSLKSLMEGGKPLPRLW